MTGIELGGQGTLFAWCPVHGWVTIGTTDGPVLHMQQAPAPCPGDAGAEAGVPLHLQRQRGADITGPVSEANRAAAPGEDPPGGADGDGAAGDR